MSNDFSSLLISWYSKHMRQLPWRNTNDPYKIWLSEIILQQTRVAQGLPYYQNFIEKYPDVKVLASAPEEEVLRMWQGLGYYSRARNLHACAKEVVEKYDGFFPEDYISLQTLKGIGKYTAAAIASFAFKEAVPVVDGNVFRVLARYFSIEENIADTKNFAIFFNTALEIIPKDQPDLFNQAMMELGATICTPGNPACIVCPVSVGCTAREKGTQKKLPVKEKKVKVRQRFFYYLMWEKDDKIAMKKRGPQDIWQGLFDFDLIESKTALNNNVVEETILAEVPDAEVLSISAPVKHVLTHQRIEAVFIGLKNPSSVYLKERELSYFKKEQIEELPKPILIDKYLKGRIN
ncbi:A/G-specific adenine glycosylase [Marivirga lumbricoides]|uniref:Adenine DNA glycosylase n=1 Tax=Marivirga lumbricoides TaxID=1046115 RepID=A0A2T4DVV9_9BACT|nr:A/G-specific adenine glycosylase [Marivirga lumbricoides]